MGDEAQVLARELKGAVEEAARDLPSVGVAFSGGLDSSLLAHLLETVIPVRLYAAGVKGSSDLNRAAEAAALLGLPLETVFLDALWMEEALETLTAHFGPSPGIIPFEVPLLAVALAASPSDLITGQGADELFGGYHRYGAMKSEELEEALRKDVAGVLTTGHAREAAMVASVGGRLICPYLDPRVVAAARVIPARRKVSGPERKVVLREAAALLGLPGPLVARAKKAAQYGSGSLKLLRTMARDRGMDLGAYLCQWSSPSGDSHVPSAGFPV